MKSILSEPLDDEEEEGGHLVITQVEEELEGKLKLLATLMTSMMPLR